MFVEHQRWRPLVLIAVISLSLLRTSTAHTRLSSAAFDCERDDTCCGLVECGCTYTSQVVDEKSGEWTVCVDEKPNSYNWVSVTICTPSPTITKVGLQAYDCSAVQQLQELSPGTFEFARNITELHIGDSVFVSKLYKNPALLDGLGLDNLESVDFCEAGTIYNPDSPGQCEDCPAGRYGVGCRKACTPGKYTASAGQHTEPCVDCPAGKHQMKRNATSCSNCPHGRYSDVPGMSACTLCANGQYTNTTRATSCISNFYTNVSLSGYQCSNGFGEELNQPYTFAGRTKDARPYFRGTRNTHSFLFYDRCARSSSFCAAPSNSSALRTHTTMYSLVSVPAPVHARI
jgi:hypothetical protein